MVTQSKMFDYIEGCFKTWNHSGWDRMVLNASLGIIGEVGEILELTETSKHYEDVISEHGDLLYYTCVLCSLTEYYEISASLYISGLYERYKSNRLRILNEYGHVITVIDIVKSITQLAELNKKVFFHNKSVDETKWCNVTDSVLIWLFDSIEHYGLTLDEVMEYNTNKLKKRYPEGFKAVQNVN